MPNIDIVARLQLRAEQFSSETGARFSEMKTRARSAANEVRESFSSSFAEVQKLAQTALVMPRTTGGSLDLSGEISQLRASATVADQRAIALRELSVAQTAAANSGRADAEALRLEADASAVASLAEEHNAQAIRTRIGALEAVQGELNRTITATELHTAVGAHNAVSAGQQRAAMQQLGFQLNDIATSYSGGAKFSMIFAQQSGQVIQALQLMTNGTKGFLGWLGSPWGTVAAAATIVLIPLVSKMLDFNSAEDDAIDKLKKDALQSDITRQAKERFKTTAEGVHQAIIDQSEALRKSIDTEKSAAEQANIAADRERDRQLAIRATTVALLEKAKVEADSRLADASDGKNVVQGIARAQAVGQRDDLVAQLAKANSDLDKAQRNVQLTRINLAAEQAKTDADPIAQINKKYDEQIIALKNLKRAQIERGVVVGDVTKQELAGIEAKRRAELKAEQERERKPRTVSLGDQLQNEQGQRLLTSAEGYRGLSETRDNGTLRDLFSKANINVDPKMVAWCAAFVNSVLATNGLPGTGSLSARSFLGYGEKTEKPEKGDIVVSRRGTGDQGHVGFYEGLDAKGNVKVLGGNTGDKVGVETVKRADVLGFRRAPTATEAYKAEEEQAKKNAELERNAADNIARINAQWDEQPRLIDRAGIETNKLDEIIADLTARKPPGFEKLIADAQHAKQTIQDGINRPYDDYVKSQRESVAVQSLVLQGRDAEASAMQVALRLQKQMGTLSDDQLATILRIEQQQQKIADALEDQRRIVGLYSGAVGDVEQQFNTFLDGLRTKPGAALKNLVGGFVDSFSKLQNSLTTEQLFGGMQRDIERYVAQKMGGSTPADMLKQQLGNAGTVLNEHVDATGTALDDFVAAVRGATARIGDVGSPTSIAPMASKDITSTAGFDTMTDEIARSLATGNPKAANDNDIVVEASRDQVAALNKNSAAMMSASDLFNKVGSDLVTNFERVIGIKLPSGLEKTLKDNLGPVLQGASNGQLGGSVFASLTGSKNNPLASSIGGVLGEVGGKALGKTLSTVVTGGLGKALGAAGGPIGSILGGVLGNVIGGLFSKPKWSDSTISLGANGQVSGNKASGTSGQAIAAATGTASSVASGINAIAQQLGAKIQSLPALTLGTFDSKYRVATTATSKSLNFNNFTDSVLHDFGGDQQAAIEYAVRYSISNAVLTGISQASQNILKSGQDLQSAISKALLIESVPKDLKARLDPVGAAIDAVTLKFDNIFATLKEGGATAQQTADAQKLFNLELADAKNNTATASAGLKTFFDSLKMGSSSPLSLRDQEASAKSALQPYLDQIGSGQSINQDKYQAAAQTYLDIERQLNGSTSAYFAEFDKIQAATAKAIDAIDGVSSIAGGASDAAISSTAANTAATAKAATTTNELLDQLSQQTNLTNSLLAKLAGSGVDLSDFVGNSRGYVAKLVA